ncbi:precorrin-6y C5,15-methyltransferase (decarboxylating), CbiE subunit [Methanohalobium evestigatum Z-7303]|uniref:Precorrin-6y C5,15-methyltransferase (Decarboxylating), CbiE subunit n=1 Tax=Methanohalobium evestigatum (strain ATCC BAA-1072 / DSM 3721 / NBRC 107634 / OCM 161 / Z-7303) TaxID=644295 RepID=D7EAL8_METEZ|nr:cobalt-precorrin-7 (C(5))-methyltransferase [Methanohalobium evestigatum]ADI75017.1 precorrin-6y C5,15-methyltransferase (decarboxylating), CbiE subunit [Methanohalobium evestigatum Z-7303]
MIIVGVGVGPGMLTEEAIEAIKNAPVVYGSKRAIETAEKYITGKANKIRDYKNLHLLPDDAVVLSTGDPLFSGLGKYASKNDRIIPGISSLHLACARLGVNMTELAAITAHGRGGNHSKHLLVQELKLGKNVLLLPDASFGPNEVAKVLHEFDINADIYTCEELGYPNERITGGNRTNPPEVQSKLYCIMIVQK